MMESPLPGLLDAAVRGALLALLLLLAAALARARPRAAHRQLGLALALGLCVQVIASMPWLEESLRLRARAPLIAVSVGNAVLFWLLVRSMIDDEFRLRRRDALVWLAVVVGVGLNTAFVLGRGVPASPVMAVVQGALPAFFALLTVIAAARHWRADLVEDRRWLRGFIVMTGLAYTFALVFARGWRHGGRLTTLAATADESLLLAIVAVIAFRLLRLGEVLGEMPSERPEMLPAPEPHAPSAMAPVTAPVAPVAPPSAPDPAELRLAAALDHAMRVQLAYRTEDLTVALLAAKLAVPEYRLRRLINQRLGHRNFNVYVNGFRLAEARDALADPAKRGLPILTIALTAGFQSIGPFNRAFKLATGLTPGEFRREKLADS